MANKPVCEIDGCFKGSKKRGWCDPHYKKWWRHGDPLHDSGIAESGALPRFCQEAASHNDRIACLIWPYGMDRHGYGLVHIGVKNRNAHRVVCELAHGEPPTKKHVAAHNCGKGHEGCVNPHHLRWATREENAQDQVEHGTKVQGETHGASKLTEEQVREIIAAKGKLLQREIAKEHGIKREAVSKIHRGIRWKHING